jgi:SUN domain-containing protein 1/2
VSSAIVDYASLSAGGKTINTLTSATYSLTQRKRYGIFSKVREVPSPAVALTEGLEFGQCWAFHGGAGQLGIQLAHAIRVSSLVVGHVNISSTASAPKKLVLWGLKPANSDLCTVLRDVDTPSPDFGFGYCGIRLLSVIHEPSCSTLYQNFTITPVSSHYFDQFLVQILENWGHPSFTCIYHIQIYGNI